MAGHIFSRIELDTKLKNVVGKTLGEVDVNNVFDKAIKIPKITGIAGDVIEQSVLGYPADSSQDPDLIVDGIATELKTTGIRKPKKKSDFLYEAKEPMSITAVSPEKITQENFETSSFWHKLERMLIVYYHYNSLQTVKALDYANFPIEGYHFHEFSAEDREILKNDWSLVQSFIKDLQDNYEIPEDQYPRISSELRKELMLIDTAPKWPNRPRFRLKRSAVTNMVQKCFGETLEELDTTYSTFKDLDEKLHELTELHSGKTVEQLMKEFNIPLKLNSKQDVTKSISERIVIKMFGGSVSKISKIELFNKIGLAAKTITQTEDGGRTEDTKLFAIDFGEWTDENINFEDSFVYNYLSNQQFLCIIFEEPTANSKLLENKFIGFKRLMIPEQLIENDMKVIWQTIRSLIKTNQLKESVLYDRNGNPKITPKTKVISTSINFPKSKDYIFFVRGSGEDANKKTLSLNGIQMYRQELWVRGKDLVSMLQEVEYI